MMRTVLVNTHRLRCAQRLAILLLVVLWPASQQASGQTLERPEIRAAGQKSAAAAQDATTPASDPLQVFQVQVEQLASQLAKEDVDESARSAMTQQLELIRKDLARTVELRQSNADLQKKIDKLTATAEELREDPEEDVLAASKVDAMSVEELETAVASLRVQRSNDDQEMSRLQDDLEKIAVRKTTLQEQLLGLEQRVEDAIQELDQHPSDSPSLRAAIERKLAEIQNLKVTQQRNLTRSQLANTDAEMSLNIPAMRVSRQQKLIAARQSRLKILQPKLEERRQQQSRAELNKAQRREHELEAIENKKVQEIGKEQLVLAKENNSLAQQFPQWQSHLEKRRTKLKELQSEQENIRRQVIQFGADATNGRWLLHFGTKLTSIDELQAELAEIDKLTAGLQTRSLEYQSHEQRVLELTDELGESVGPAEQEILASSAVLLGQVTYNNSQLFRVLTDVNGADLETIAFVNDWTEFVQEHALWLRSHDRLSQNDLQQSIPELMAGGSELWRNLRSGFAFATWSFWLFCVPAVFSVVLLLSLQSRAKRRLVEQGELATARSCITIRPTFWALLLSFGMAAEWPLLFMFVGTMLTYHTHDSVIAFGNATVHLGGIALWLNFLRQVLRSDGLATDHLDWPPVICAYLRRWLRLMLAVLAIPMFLFLLAYETQTEADSVERILFLLLQVCSAIMVFRLVFPPNGVFVSTVSNSFPLLDTTRYLWTTSLVLAPLMLAVCSAAGFHHTAISIWIRLGWSIVMISGAIMCWSLVLRWLTITHRAMRLTLARERAQKRGEAGETAEQSLIQQASTDDSDFLFYGKQARQLVRNVAVLVIIGCAWGIWFDVLPALRGLDRHVLWNVDDTVMVADTNSEGETTESVLNIRRPVTVVNLLLVAFVGAATFVGVRQLPGLIEVILIRQTGFDSGVRYTITTVFRYAMLIVGTTVVFHLLGLRWSQVQWLVAGLSVGLGFGLQEVFANFVSGIIILVERPIRIGDVVTIDGVSGVVSRIQIRATSITDWDRREYIVPNRELVTGKLLNWTLSDSTNRIMISVGIGYSSDPDLARETMLRIAREHPNVMEDPAPVATFENFGDSSLDLILRAYLPDMDNRLATITEIHTQILRAFAEAEINIPYPQREVKML